MRDISDRLKTASPLPPAMTTDLGFGSRVSVQCREINTRMERPLSHPTVPYDTTTHGPGQVVRLLLDLAVHQDRQVLCEVEDWLLDLTPGTWGRWADPERVFWSFEFADDVYAVQFILKFK